MEALNLGFVTKGENEEEEKEEREGERESTPIVHLQKQNNNKKPKTERKKLLASDLLLFRSLPIRGSGISSTQSSCFSLSA